MASPSNDTARRRIRRQATAIAIAVAPFGLAFGIAAHEAGLSLLEAVGFSVFVFTGSAQFAAVTVLGDGGTAAAAISAGLLLNLRSLAFGVAMAPALTGSPWWRAGASQLMIDESTAVASAQPTRSLQRYGYLVGGIAVFIAWNLATLLGASFLSSSESLITDLGIDAAIPATFLALLWGRLRDRQQLVLAVVGAALAIAFVPFSPAGIPILVAGSAVVLARPWRDNT